MSNFYPWFVALIGVLGIKTILYLSGWLVAEHGAAKAFLRERDHAQDPEDDPSLRGARTTVSTTSRWAPVILFVGLCVSVFFSFNALIDVFYNKSQNELADRSAARSAIAALLKSFEQKMVQERDAEFGKVVGSDEWKVWQKRLQDILAKADRVLRMNKDGEGARLADRATSVVDDVRQALGSFGATGTSASFGALETGCQALVALPQVQHEVDREACVPTALSERLEGLNRYDRRLARYRKDCSVDDTFNALPSADRYVDKGRLCADLSGLPLTTITMELDAIEQENSVVTSRFQRSLVALRRGNPLALLALALAFAIDFLVFVASVVGARAAIFSMSREVEPGFSHLDMAEKVDLRIFPGDPQWIRIQKLLLSLLYTDLQDEQNGNHVVAEQIIDARRAPGEYAVGLRLLLSIYSSQGLVRAEHKYPGSYRVPIETILRISRQIGQYEHDMTKVCGHRRDDEGWLVNTPSSKQVSVQFSRASVKIDENASGLDSRRSVELRGVRIAQEDLQRSGGAYNLEQVRELMNNASVQYIEDRVREGSILAVPGPNNKPGYPIVQFKNGTQPIDGLSAVINALPTKDGFAILNFLVNPNGALSNRKPIDLLNSGHIDMVVEAAKRLGEQGS